MTTTSRKETSITSLIDIHDDLKKGDYKWCAIVLGFDGKLYGIPFKATHVVQFHPTDTPMKQIGPHFSDDGIKWSDGVMADSGVIYCIPFVSDKVLKIETNVGENNGNVTIIDAKLPEEGANAKWASGATSKIDGCIYCMPFNANRILKIDPKDDSFQSVGEDLGNKQYKFSGAIADENGIIYGIPYWSKQIIKIDPNPNNPDSTTVTNVGEAAKQNFECGGGVLAMDGNIYSSNEKGDILVIDVAKGSHSWILNTFQSTHAGQGWGNPLVGMDGCIYWLPRHANRLMRLNINTLVPELIGNDLGDASFKWNGGALASDGKIYCIPYSADKILEIDSRPIKMLYDYKVGGTSDSPHGEPDRLGFHVYAEALSRVIRAVEAPNTSLCVGLFAPWGAGKTFFYNLIKDDLVKSAEAMRGRDLGTKNKNPTVLRVSWIRACNGWYYFALGLTKALGLTCHPKSPDRNSIATAVLLSFPIGISIWMIIFLLCLLVLMPISIPYNCFGRNAGGLISYLLLRRRSYYNEEDDDQIMSTYEEWKHVCNIFTGKTDLQSDLSEGKSLRDISSLGKLQTALLLCVQLSYQGLSALVSSLTCPIHHIFRGTYKLEEEMTKYIFVSFNVSQEEWRNYTSMQCARL